LVVQPVQQPLQAVQPAYPGEREADDPQEGQKDRQRGNPLLRCLGRRGEQQRQQQDRDHLGQPRCRHHQLAKLGFLLVCVRQQRQQQPSRGRGEHDRQEHRLATEPGEAEGIGAQQAEGRRRGVRHARHPPERSPQPPHVDLQAGQEQQHSQAEIAQHLDRRVHMHPAQHGRADDYPGDDLKNRAGHG
jgi:hypothetical protein